MKTERERHAERLGRLAEAVREAAKRLPNQPISGEVVACAGIMGMANWLEDVAALLRRAEPPIIHERDEASDWICCCGDHLSAEPEREPGGGGDPEAHFVEFGTGHIHMIPAQEPNDGPAIMVLRRVPEQHTIGETSDDYTPGDKLKYEPGDVVLRFAKFSSIRVLAEDLFSLIEKCGGSVVPTPESQPEPREDPAYNLVRFGTPMTLGASPESQPGSNVTQEMQAAIGCGPWVPTTTGTDASPESQGGVSGTQERWERTLYNEIETRYSPADECYLARWRALSDSGLMADGPTREDAVADLISATETYMLSLIEDMRKSPPAAPQDVEALVDIWLPNKLSLAAGVLRGQIPREGVHLTGLAEDLDRYAEKLRAALRSPTEVGYQGHAIGVMDGTSLEGEGEP